jgi:hypothetical protein
VNLDSLDTRALSVAERRVRHRIRLHWPLSILKEPLDDRALSTVTENLSSSGFGCVVDEPLRAGDTLTCILGFPLRHDPRISQALRCQAQVVWVTALDNGRFSMGCRIDDYAVIS